MSLTPSRLAVRGTRGRRALGFASIATGLVLTRGLSVLECFAVSWMTRETAPTMLASDGRPMCAR
jgi:hypothetical protein